LPLDLRRFFLEEGAHLNFFQAAWLLERLYPGKGRPGTGDDLKAEAVRFETLNSLGFPAGDVAAILPPLSLQGQAQANLTGKDSDTVEMKAIPTMEKLPDIGKGPLRMVLTFMGLYGVSSPLPAYFVDPITLRKVEYFELKKFLDVFSHRMYALFYRSWKKYRHFAQYRPDLPDDYTLRLLALTGQWPRRAARSASALPEARGPVHDLRRIPFARFLGNRVRSAKGLQQLLRGYFGFPKVRVLQFAPAWVEIPVPTRLGSGDTALGSTARLGERMEDMLSRFVVEIGPLPRAWFDRFLPSARRIPPPRCSRRSRTWSKPTCGIPSTTR
jgi:type VI secretion system protein ImpH